MTSVRFLCLVSGGIKTQICLTPKPSTCTDIYGRPAQCSAECSFFSELPKLLDLGLGEPSVWRKTKHQDHQAGGCLRLTVCDSVLWEVVCVGGDRYILSETSPGISRHVIDSFA